MSFNVAGILIFLSVCGIVISNPDRSIDCRKFVFAPLCRGVAAKRALYELMNFANDESNKPTVKPFLSSMRSLMVEDNESLKSRINPFETALRSLAPEDYKNFRKLLKPLEFAVRSIAPQDNESLDPLEKSIESEMKPITSQEHERACETF